jgi:hypothetical protein
MRLEVDGEWIICFWYWECVLVWDIFKNRKNLETTRTFCVYWFFVKIHANLYLAHLQFTLLDSKGNSKSRLVLLGLQGKKHPFKCIKEQKEEKKGKKREKRKEKRNSQEKKQQTNWIDEDKGAHAQTRHRTQTRHHLKLFLDSRTSNVCLE